MYVLYLSLFQFLVSQDSMYISGILVNVRTCQDSSI